LSAAGPPVAAQRYRPDRASRRLAGPLFAAACLVSTLIGVVVLAVLLGSLVSKALGDDPTRPWTAVATNARDLATFLWGLVGRTPDTDPALAGFKVGIVSTLWLLGLVALFAVPIGAGAGLFLEEFAPPGRWRRAIQTNIANLAGVPSIVYGILGLAVFVRGFGLWSDRPNYSLWAGALTLGLLVLPVIVIATQEALRTVPPSLRQAALALGASRWQVTRDHVLPAALPGIFTGVILALSRAIGETAPLLMVAQAASLLRPPRGPGDDYVALPVEIYTYAASFGPEFQRVAAGGILILLAILLSMNAVAIVLRQRTSRRPRA